MNLHRRRKYSQFKQLASQVTDNCIVELGAYRGNGTIALCQGATVPVYAIDDYSEKRGWAKEQYTKANRQIFFGNINDAGVAPHLIIGDVHLVCLTWNKPISLLVWDLGMLHRLESDFNDWSQFVTDKFVIHDTDDLILGTDKLNPDGWRKYKQGVLWILERQSM